MTALRSTTTGTTFATLLLLVVAAFWGLNATASKFLYNPAGLGMDGIGLFVARSAWTLPLFLALALRHRPKTALPTHDWWRLAALGVMFGPLQTGVFALGTQHTSAAHVVMLFSLSPPLTAVLSAFLLRESISPVRTVALGVGIAGALLLMLTRSASGSHLTGDALILVMVVSFSFTAVLMRGFAAKYSPLFITGVYGTFGTLLLIVVGACMGRLGAIIQPLSTDPLTLFWFFGIIVLGLSLVAQIAQTFALRVVSATTFSVVTSYASLLVGVASSIVIVHEQIGPTGVVAGALLACALGLALVAKGTGTQPRGARTSAPSSP